MTEAAKRDSGILDKVGGWKRAHVAKNESRWGPAWRWLRLGVRKPPRPAYRGLYEPADPRRRGVCCSGGGVRSAAFNLGALQALQDKDELQKTEYLSAVSGGSYIASAFCMVAKTREQAGLDPALFSRQKGLPFAPGTPEEQYLRNHLSYLAPSNSAKLYLALRMVAGLLVNVLLIGLPVMMLGLLIGLAFDGPYGTIADGSITVPRSVWAPIALLAAGAVLAAVIDILWRPGKDRWQTALQTWEVRLFVLAAIGAVALIAVPWLASRAAHVSNPGTKGAQIDEAAGDGVFRTLVAAASSIVALAGAAITHVRGTIKDHQKTIKAVEGRSAKFAATARDGLVAIAVMLAGPLLLVAVASLGVLVSVNSADHGRTLLGAAALLLLVMWIFVDLTTVSLHPFYRRRLASAFALRRVDTGDAVTAEERPFDDLVELSKTDVEGAWPTLIVCAAANVSDPGATPPGRSVASFTFSPTAIGGPLTGATKAVDYEALGRNRRRDVTLPAAVAMSGAAVSPSMGKLTYRPLTFLLALANIRLGVWVLNPRRINESVREPTADDKRSSTLAPNGPSRETASTQRISLRHRPRPQYLWKELFGRNRLEDKFLYVTDGGHYENLGLMELLRRGCGTIYCFDAGGGVTSKALGDAIALARTELNIEIQMSPTATDLAEDPATRLSKVVCAEGTIVYPPAAPNRARVTGRLFYVRSVVSDETPWDLRSYQVDDGIFPHDSTFDQFLTDQKFEAYRRLGSCGAEAAMVLSAAPKPKNNGGVKVTQAQTYSATGKPQLELDQ